MDYVSLDTDLNVSNSATTTFADDALAGSGIDGVGGFLKTGLGTLTLAGLAAQRKIRTQVRMLSVETCPRVQKASALGSIAGNTIVKGGSLLNIDGGTFTIPEPLTLGANSPNSTGTLQNFTGANTWSGPITLDYNASLVVATASTLQVTGGINLVSRHAHRQYCRPFRGHQ